MATRSPTLAEAPAKDTVLLARQPIFDQQLSVVAYELLFRKGDDHRAAFSDGDLATSRVIRNAFMDLGVDRIVGAQPAYINLTGNLILNGTARLLPRNRVVIEILEDVFVDTELVHAVRDLVHAGYQVALDDFVWRPDLRPLVDLASVVKLDVLALSWDQLARQVERLREWDVELLAEKIENHRDFERCVDLGFEYFQGYFLCRPDKVRGRNMPTNKLMLLELMRKVYDPNVRVQALEQLIRRDVSLSYRLLRLINSAYYGLPRKVDSIHDAMVLLGLRFVKRWVTLLAMAGFDDKPPELFTIAMTRAKMCEALAKAAGNRDVESFFVVGLFSILDAVMDRPLPEVLEDLPLSEQVIGALLHRAGPIGQALDCVIAHEQGMWHRVRFAELSADAIQGAYYDAMAWVSDTRSLLND